MVEPQLVRDFVATGQVYFEYRNYAFLGDESVEAAEAALCANDQGKFWEMHDAIFANQVGENNGAFARSRLNRIAETVTDLDMEAWGACMDGDVYEDDVRDTKAEGDDLGVRGTPSFTVNGELSFGPTYEELTQQIQAALGESTTP